VSAQAQVSGRGSGNILLNGATPKLALAESLA